MPVTDYLQIATTIVKKQAGLLGLQLAVKKARKVMDMVVTDEGNVVTIGTNPAQSIDTLIEEYEKLSGTAAIMFSKEATRDLLNNPSITIPSKLKE